MLIILITNGDVIIIIIIICLYQIFFKRTVDAITSLRLFHLKITQPNFFGSSERKPPPPKRKFEITQHHFVPLVTLITRTQIEMRITAHNNIPDHLLDLNTHIYNPNDTIWQNGNQYNILKKWERENMHIFSVSNANNSLCLIIVKKIAIKIESFCCRFATRRFRLEQLT